ncbi:MAG TPA: DUF885 domain-containing protein, partial [Solirubrobacteraceae bacterium]
SVAADAAPSTAVPSAAASSSPAPARPAWIARSDENAKLLLDVETQFTPESASHPGVEAADERTLDLSPGYHARHLAALQDARRQLEACRAAETDPQVAQDLAILLHAADLRIREMELTEKTLVPHWDVARIVFDGIHALLSDQVAPARRARALVRLRRYAGLEPGSTPLTELARADIQEHLARPGLVPPARIDLEKSLSTSATLRDGIEKLFMKYGLTGYEDAMRALSQQLAAYDDFVRATVLPRARTDFALPPAVYALRLERFGVDIPQEKLVAMAHAEFTAIQAQMQQVAARVAKERRLPSADYRDVLRELKKDQIVGDAVLPHYRQRLADIEAIIRREHLVTLPSRPARIRLASAAESAQQPAPHMSPPRLLNNTGEQGEFVLPLSIPAPTGSKEAEQKYDDFSFAAASWTLTAHEARPGHELQFDSMVEHGGSLARAHYAFNSANVEGWGLYAEAIMLPFMPPDGQLVSLQLRLLRAARAFLDPELQQHKWTFDSARDFLQKEVGLSRAFATAEVERYTFRMPGQATSYFYGLTRLLDLRREAEQKLGPRFDAQKFHDAILGEGLLPPDLLRTAVLAKLGAG